MVNVLNSVLTIITIVHVQPCPSEPMPAKSSDTSQLKCDAFSESLPNLNSLGYFVTIHQVIISISL